MDDQVGDVGDGGRICLLLARSGDESHEVAERLGVVEQLPQLHADPCRVEDAHVEREQLRQPVQRARVVSGQPHRVGARGAVGQGDFLEAENEVLTGRRVGNVDRPRQGAVGAGLWFLGAEQGILDRRRAITAQCTELLDTPADDLRHRRDDRGYALALAMRRQRHVEGFARGLGKRIELHLEPGEVIGAHVHRQRLGDGAQTARFGRAVGPYLERPRAAVLLDVADEERELADR